MTSTKNRSRRSKTRNEKSAIKSPKNLSWSSKTREERLAIKLTFAMFFISLSITLLTGYTSYKTLYGPQTTGLITHSMVDKNEPCFHFEYQYQVKDQVYRGYHISGLTSSSNSIGGCYRDSETVSTFWGEGELAQGKEVTVHYMEDFPSVATLKPEFNITFYIPLILTLAGLFFTVGIYTKGLAK